MTNLITRWRGRDDNLLRLLTHVGALAPLGVILWKFFTDTLSANPIQDVTLRTGIAALVLLVLSLACTPINILFKFKPVLRIRRTLGLYAFLYVGLHLLIFVVLDYSLDLDLLREAILEKLYALVGFTAFLILLPLAITSTKGWQKRLGKKWKRLHKGVYLAALLAVVHYTWLVKSDVRQPLAFGAVVVLLLIVRLPWVRRGFRNQVRWGKDRRPRNAAPQAKIQVSPAATCQEENPVS